MSTFSTISGDDVLSTRWSNVEWSISLVGEELFSMILNDDGLVDEIVSTSLNDEESVDGFVDEIVSTFLKDEESVDGIVSTFLKDDEFVDEIVSTSLNDDGFVDGIVSTSLNDEGLVDEIVSTFRNSEFSFSASVDSGAVLVELKKVKINK
jgi:hypothetical protein